jgi:hypothetical protein
VFPGEEIKENPSKTEESKLTQRKPTGLEDLWVINSPEFLFGNTMKARFRVSTGKVIKVVVVTGY